MLLRALIVAVTMSLATAEYVSPVFLWGVESPPKSSLQTVTKETFADLLAPLLKSHMVVVFQEEYLSSKDFLCRKVDGLKSCYAHLSEFSPKIYYASVENPIEALRTLTKSREYNIVDSTGKLQAPLECTPGKVNFVSFDNVTSDGRANILEAHDVAIANIAKGWVHCSIVYLYMSTPNSAKLRVRRKDGDDDGFHTYRNGNQFLIHWAQLLYNDGTNNNREGFENGFQPLKIIHGNVDNHSASLFGVSLYTHIDYGYTMKYEPLQFNISLGADGYYTMSNIELDGQTFYTSSLSAPTTFSYHCGNLTFNTKPTEPGTPIAYLKWNSLQFQAPFNDETSENFAFGDSWDCVPFFTPGILSGLLVVIFLLAIMFTGICCMIDINTMDRFDDPQAKTITINASE